MSEKTDDYSWVTDEMFDEALCYLLEDMGSISLIKSIPGVYELVKEEYNNDVLAKLEEWRNEE